MTFECLLAYYEENICLNIIIIIVEYTLQSLYYTISYIRGTAIHLCVFFTCALYFLKIKEQIFVFKSRNNKFSCSELHMVRQLRVKLQSRSDLKTIEWWISRSMIDQVSRLNIACSPLVINLQIN